MQEQRGERWDAEEASFCVTAVFLFPQVSVWQILLNSVRVSLCFPPLRSRLWFQPAWIIHSYIKRSFPPRRVVMFQQKLNEVDGAASHVPRWMWTDAASPLPPLFPTGVQVWRVVLSSIGHLMHVIPPPSFQRWIRADGSLTASLRPSRFLRKMSTTG